MNIYLDESGIHLKAGHSVFALVAIANADLPRVNQAMERVHLQIGVVPIHWAKLRWENREIIFQGLRQIPFTFQIAVFNNPIINADKAARETLGRLLAGGTVSKIHIDGKKSKAYSAQLKVTLRQAGISTRKLVTVKDEAVPGIQIADLIAGLYRHQLDKPSRESAALQALIALKQQ